MSLVVPIAQLDTLLTLFLNVEMRLKLYSNALTPDENTVIGDFTEVAGGGYAAIPLLAGNWFVDNLVYPVLGYQAEKTFTFTGPTSAPTTIYGYYITNVAGTTLYWSESFPGSVTPFIPGAGSTIKVTPRISFSGGA